MNNRSYQLMTLILTDGVTNAKRHVRVVVNDVWNKPVVEEFMGKDALGGDQWLRWKEEWEDASVLSMLVEALIEKVKEKSRKSEEEKK